MLPMDAVALTQTLVRMNTINPPGDEEQCTKYLTGLLSSAGFECASYSFAPQRTSLVARIGGVPGTKPLCFTGHIDVVPLGTVPWSHDPFAAEIVDGKLYGRGTSDMKSGVAAFVTAALSLATQLKNGPGLVLVITAGEETGCEGAYHLAALNRAQGVLGEAGAMVVAEPTGNYPLVGHKGALWLKATTSGVTAHGSMPHLGDNAIHKAARAVNSLQEFDFVTPSHPLMGNPTLNIGTIRGGLNINSVPDSTEIGIDIRSVPGQEHAALLDRLRLHLPDGVNIEPMVNVESVYTSPDITWMQNVFEITERITGEKIQPRSVAFFTDASALKPAYDDVPTVILGPGEAAMAHQTDEYCRVDRIQQAVDIYCQIIRDWVEQ